MTEKYQLLPPLPPEQFEALKADIAERGVIVPVIVDEFGIIIDGHNRARACRELGKNDLHRSSESSSVFPRAERAIVMGLTDLTAHTESDPLGRVKKDHVLFGTYSEKTQEKRVIVKWLSVA